MSITIGWWIIPLIITAITTAYVFWPVKNPAYGYSAVGQAGVEALKGLVAIIIMLLSWLIWSLFA